MPNGERIQFGPNINFIFETHDLSFASPATVSRMGMIYLSDETMDTKILVEGWLQKRPKELVENLKDWIEKYLFKAIDSFRLNYEAVVETTKAGLIFNGLSQVQNAATKLSFLFGIIKGIGSNLLLEARLKFANEVLEWGKEICPDPKKSLDYTASEKGKFELYQKGDVLQTDLKAMKDLDNLPVVETLDMVKTLDVLLPWLRDGQPILVVGPEGAGKNTSLRHCFSQLKNTSVSVLHCSSQTTSSQILQRLYQSCIAATTANGRVLRPKDAEKLVLYLKDINLPSPDKYATVELIQFLQQLLTFNGFFDTSLEWISIENIQIVASMNPSSSMGRHKLSTRFTSIIRILYLGYPEKDQLQNIYRSFVKPVVEECLPGHPFWSLSKNILNFSATIVNVYEQTKQKFTVDMYPHYVFNPRDVSRLIVSLSRYVYQSNEEKELLDVFSYECQRIFADRLVNADSRLKFQHLLNSILRSEWSYDGGSAGSVYSLTSGASGFSRFGMDSYRETLKPRVVQYERETQDLNLELFPEQLEQLSHIERVISQPGGSLLLAGRPGIDFYKLVSFSSYLRGFAIFSPKSPGVFNIKSFQNDLKQLLQIATVENRDVLFMVEDYQITNPTILEILNSLLYGSDVGGVYTPEELDGMTSQLKDTHSQEGFRGTVYEFFMARVRRNLHLVLIFDSASPDFVARCEANPALYTRCQLIWLDAWSQDSMDSIAQMVFGRSASLSLLKDQRQICKELLQIHQSCAGNSATPKNFSELLEIYESIYKSKRDSTQKKQTYLAGGLKKLGEASAFVDKLSNDAKDQQIELAKKQKEADSALKEITESMVTASEQKKEMESLTEKLKEEEIKITTRKIDVEKELAEVEPIIKAAQAAVGEIRAESLSEIRSLRAPPPAIRDVLEAVLRLMGNLDMSWNSMKGFLGQRTVKEEILNFDVRSISKSTREAVAELIRQKENSFEESVIKRASVAAAPLALWVKANIQYATVVEKVAPLENEMKKLTDSLNQSKTKVRQLKEALDSVDAKVEALRDEFGVKTREAEGLRIGLERAMEIMNRAQGLLEKLSGEGERWEAQFQELDNYIVTLPRNALLAAAFVVYLGGESEDVRKSSIARWQSILGYTDSFNFRSIMSSESDQLVWKSQGLPADALSNENAIIVINNHATSLLIDPSGQSSDWLKTHLREKKPEVVNQHDDSFLRSLELSVRFGKTLIVQEVADIDPILFPLIRKTLIKQGPRFVVELGEKTIDYNNDFRLYLVTKRPDFVLPSNAIGYVNVVNFTITRAGLAGQLLGVTLEHENPQLQVQKIELLKKEEEFKIRLAQLEEQLLNELADSEGNILENKGLIQSLNEAKEKSLTIAKSLAESKTIQQSLDQESELFSPIAHYGSILYFVLSDLKKLNNMYQFSLGTFLHLFRQALATDSSDPDVEVRNSTLLSILEKLVYNYISRAIFKADRHTFALYMIRALHTQMFEPSEWDLFLGKTMVADAEPGASDVPSWVPLERQGHYQKLQTALPSLCKQLNFAEDCWAKWCREPSCELSIPRDRISPFQKVLIVQTFRPDRLLSAISNFCLQALPIESLSPSPLSLVDLHDNETTCANPILFIATPGTDPSAELREFGKARVGPDNYQELAMGQGQGDAAIQLIRKAAKTGGWVCLQNVHLVIGWMKQLEKELSSCTPDPKFRLWLTSEAHPRFPPTLLASCVKVTVEAPPGIKKNLKIIYDGWTPEFIAQGPVIRAQALFALAWFHAVIQERRNFIPQGWNKFYEYSSADLRSSAELISNLFYQETTTVQWEVVHGILKNAIYGGRVDDSQDYLKLETYLLQFFNSDVFSQEGRAPLQKICKAFCKCTLLTLALPRSTDIESYRQIISDMAETENVALFGLPANIDRAQQRNQSADIISRLSLMDFEELQSKKYNKDLWNQKLLPLLQIWKKISTAGDVMQQQLVLHDDCDPIQSFLELETVNGIKLLHKINNDLNEVSRVLRGNSLLSNYTQSLGQALLRDETPEAWKKLWDGPEKAQHFMDSAVSKATSVLQAVETYRKGEFFVSSISLGIFFQPVTFLNALRQQTSRKLNRPMDSLTLLSSWSPGEITSAISMKIDGVVVQGCLFDGNRLAETDVSDQVLNRIPPFQMAWVPSETVKMAGKQKLPFYSTVERESLITNLLVPLQGDRSAWVLAGVAFFIGK
ncbi:Cytoplasmic dynein 2 heavy chain 1 [Kappamyces sp. JEL0680]|nr:Cytoplasmic dynein 2 heavy chain 1 [Kappamyces sp. JEL0680]